MSSITDDFYIPVNDRQTPITAEFLKSMPDEVIDQFLDYIQNVPFIQNLITPDRPKAKDLPKDEDGKIIVDITKPHILEDMDYFRPAALHYEQHNCYTFLIPNKNPNSEYYRWFQEEKRRCREGYVRESDGEWVTGDMYWFLNYSPILLSKIKKGTKKADRVRDFPRVFEGIYWRSHYLQQARNEGKHAAELARRGAGKAHPYDTKVYTPDGIKLWKDIEIGDSLYGDDGNITTVTDIPFDGISPIYELTLADGRKVQASKGHLWKIRNSKGKEEIVDTEYIYNNYKGKRKVSYRNPNGNEYLFSVVNNKGIEMPYTKTAVDPYTFGLLLGDGCFRHPTYLNIAAYTCSDNDFEEISRYIPYNTNKDKAKYSYKIQINNFREILKTYGLFMTKSSEKFIPDEYLFNSREVRMSVLKGLMDSDGTVDNKGLISIELTSKRMMENIKFLCLSLGFNYRESAKTGSYKVNGNNIICKTVYRLRIYTTETLFNLQRKADKQNLRAKTNYSFSKLTGTKITNVEYIGEKLCKCVTVDNESRCYLIGDFITTHNSFFLASKMAKNLILGESSEATRDVVTILTAYQKEYLADKDGTLSKFVPMIDFVSEHTEFPRLRLRNSSQEMFWQMGYMDSYGRKKGSLNSVMGVSSKDDVDKLRGKRGFIYFEEFGNFPGLLDIYNTVRSGLEDGEYAFGQAYLIGTANNKESNFESAKSLLYEPDTHRILSVNNVYDKVKQGRPKFAYFFPAFINREGCYDDNGNSDVVAALKEILMYRYDAKYSSNPNVILSRIAEYPITPSEAIIKVKNAYFPVSSLSERLQQLDTDPKVFDDIYVGKLVQNKDGIVEFVTSGDIPIRKYGVENSTTGALEIYEMPQKNHEGEVFPNRYIIGHDPVDNDQADSSSLSSTFVLDLFTDRIVAEYTGRQPFADDNFEIVRLLCLYYRATCMYESNKKGLYAYFEKMRCTHLLALTPQYLRDKQLIKYSAFGSNAYGINATAAINNYANDRINEWLKKPITTVKHVDGEDITVTMPQLYTIRSRALLEELIAFDTVRNFDRIRSLGMAMLYREEKVILYGGKIDGTTTELGGSSLADDDFFNRNYNFRNI